MVRKKAEPLVGMGRDPDNKLTVQKSRPLTALWQSDLTLAEFKILDTYLARIDSHKPQQRTVVFEKGEIERCLGVKQIKSDELKARIKNLGKGIDVPDEHRPGKFKTFWLFEEAECDPGDDGIWTVKLTCNDKARQYFFNVEKLGYLRYKLRCVTSLQSRYTYILFIYLEANRYRVSWEVDLEELKQLLNCHEDALYSTYKRFNERILKRCQKELHEKTECRFTYEPIRKGRPVVAVRFTLEMLSPRIEAEIQNRDPDQTSIFDNVMDHEQRSKRSLICYGFDDPVFDEFSDEELVEFRSILWNKMDYAEVEEKSYELGGNKNAAQGDLVAQVLHHKILAMNVYAKREPIKNRYSYLKKSLEEYVHVPKSEAKKSKQSSFEIDDFFAAAVGKTYEKE